MSRASRTKTLDNVTDLPAGMNVTREEVQKLTESGGLERLFDLVSAGADAAQLKTVDAGGLGERIFAAWQDRQEHVSLHSFLKEITTDPKWRKPKVSFGELAKLVGLAARNAANHLEGLGDEANATVRVPGTVVAAWLRSGASFFVPHPEVMRSWQKAEGAEILPEPPECAWTGMPPTGAILFEHARQFRVAGKLSYLRGLIYHALSEPLILDPLPPINTMVTFIFTNTLGMLQQGMLLYRSADKREVCSDSDLDENTLILLLEEMECAFQILGQCGADHELVEQRGAVTFWSFGAEFAAELKVLLHNHAIEQDTLEKAARDEARRAKRQAEKEEAERLRRAEEEAARKRAELKKAQKAQASEPVAQVSSVYDVADLVARLARADWAVLEEAQGWAAYSPDPEARPVRIDDREYDAGTWAHLMNRLRKAGWSEDGHGEG